MKDEEDKFKVKLGRKTKRSSRKSTDDFLDHMAKRTKQNITITEADDTINRKNKSGHKKEQGSTARDTRIRGKSRRQLESQKKSTYRYGLNLLDEKERRDSKGNKAPHFHTDVNKNDDQYKRSNKLKTLVYRNGKATFVTTKRDKELMKEVEDDLKAQGSFYFGSAKPKKEVDDSGRSPQSIDQVKNTQSSVLKDEEMAQDLRPREDSEEDKRKKQAERIASIEATRSGESQGNSFDVDLYLDKMKTIDDAYSLNQARKSEEEEEKSVDEKRQEFNANAIQNTPGGQNMSEVQKRKVMKEQTNSENQVRKSAETQEKKSKGEQISTKDNFMEAITFFLPSIVGGVVGHAIGGGEGAAQGVQMGMKGAADYRSAKLAREKFEHAKIQDQGDDLAKQRIEVQKSNLELRRQEVAEQRKRTTNLEDDRSLRREERKLQRQITSKESFGKRGDVKTLLNKKLLLEDTKDLIGDASELGAGMIGFKLAKGIGGEVGNLTQEEREDAQVSPSFLRSLERNATKFLMGKLPESDVKDLRKVLNVIEKKRKNNLRKIITGFGQSRYKDDKDFLDDMYNEFGVEEVSAKKSKSPSEDDLDKMSNEELKAYLGGK